MVKNFFNILIRKKITITSKLIFRVRSMIRYDKKLKCSHDLDSYSLTTGDINEPLKDFLAFPRM